jgi:5-methylcytosine-specific restriction endonuclease McrA
MVTVDSTAIPFRPKRRSKGARKRQEKRSRLRHKSTRLVKTGQVDLTPCVACGSTRDLTIHHVAPIQPDRFVFLCQPCHVLAHKPVFRTMEVCIASGHFSIRPEALAAGREEVARG